MYDVSPKKGILLTKKVDKFIKIFRSYNAFCFFVSKGVEYLKNKY